MAPLTAVAADLGWLGYLGYMGYMGARAASGASSDEPTSQPLRSPDPR